MAIRKCTKSEALEAAQKYGCSNEHEFKNHVVRNYVSVSHSDIFIESSTGAIYIGNKDGTNLQDTGIKL